MNMNLKLGELEQIAEYLPVGIMVFDPKMSVRLWNEPALNLLGIGIEDLLSGTIPGLMEEKVLAAIAAARQGETSSRQRLMVEQGERTISYTVRQLPGNGHNGDTVLIVEDATKFLEIEKIKRDFIGTLLHKLRGPLSTLKTSLSMMQYGAIEGLSPQGREILDMGYHEVNRLVTLVGDLRDLFVIETGLAEKEMDAEVFPLSAALDRAAGDLAKMAPPFDSVNKRLVRKGSLDVKVKTDFEKMKKVFSILLKNALMYSQDRTEVTVECDEKEDYVEIRVRDQGMGIAEKNMPQLFGKYFREDNEATATQEGNGLGLFIAKSYITLMKGTIYCESAQGKGSVFSLSLLKAEAYNRG